MGKRRIKTVPMCDLFLATHGPTVLNRCNFTESEKRLLAEYLGMDPVDALNKKTPEVQAILIRAMAAIKEAEAEIDARMEILAIQQRCLASVDSGGKFEIDYGYRLS